MKTSPFVLYRLRSRRSKSSSSFSNTILSALMNARSWQWPIVKSANHGLDGEPVDGL